VDLSLAPFLRHCWLASGAGAACWLGRWTILAPARLTAGTGLNLLAPVWHSLTAWEPMDLSP
jgi:hypothetical protein